MYVDTKNILKNNCNYTPKQKNKDSIIKECLISYISITLFFFFGFEETPPPGKRTLWAQVSE
jgi:hypothetical protein